MPESPFAVGGIVHPDVPEEGPAAAADRAQVEEHAAQVARSVEQLKEEARAARDAYGMPGPAEECDHLIRLPSGLCPRCATDEQLQAEFPVNISGIPIPDLTADQAMPLVSAELHRTFRRHATVLEETRRQIVEHKETITLLEVQVDQLEQKVGQYAAVIAAVDPIHGHAPGWSEQQEADQRAMMGGSIANGGGPAVGGPMAGPTDAVVIHQR